eukprot:1932654-Amphidinium_carterae.1
MCRFTPRPPSSLDRKAKKEKARRARVRPCCHPSTNQNSLDGVSLGGGGRSPLLDKGGRWG